MSAAAATDSKAPTIDLGTIPKGTYRVWAGKKGQPVVPKEVPFRVRVFFATAPHHLHLCTHLSPFSWR